MTHFIASIRMPGLTAVLLLGLVACARTASDDGEGARTSSDGIELNLVGNRFAPLDYSALDDEQRAMVQNILSGPRTGVRGPFNTLLRSPVLGDRAQALGAYIRYDSVLPATLREMAIIMTAAHWRAEYEWYAHKRDALAAGLDPAIVDAIGQHRRPARMQADEAALYDFCNELLSTQRVGDGTFSATVDAFGEQGVVDIIGTLGYYTLVSLILNVDEHPVPDGTPLQFER